MRERPESAVRRSRLIRRLSRGFLTRVPVVTIVVLSGVLNVVSALHNAPAPLRAVVTPELADLNGSLSRLGHGTQALLGITLILLGIGLSFRLRAAWAFSLLVSVITVGVNVLQHQFGASLVLPGLLLVALLLSRREFERRTIFANYLLSALSIAAVLAYGTVGADLLGAGFRPPIRDAFTALYYSVVTLSTVGYGDIVPVRQETRLFAMTLVIGGIGIFATAIASTLAPALAGQLGRLLRSERSDMALKAHVILVGGGALAENTAQQLDTRSFDYVRIMRTARAGADDEKTIVGDPLDEAVLRRAGVATALMVIAAEDDDNENAFVSLLAKDINPGLRVLAVASTEQSIRRLKLARADIVFAPTVVGGRLVANLVEGAAIPAEFQDLLHQSDAAT